MPSHSLTDLAGLRVSAEDFLAAVLETADSADELLGHHSHDTIHSKHPDGTPYPAGA